MSGRVIIIGVSDGGLETLSSEAKASLAGASFIFGGKRHLEMLGDDARPKHAWSKDLSTDVELIAEKMTTETVCVLASGDPMLHGIGVRIVDRLGADNVDVLPGPSAFSLAAARMGWSLGDPMLTCISVHALPFEALARVIQPNVRLLILSRNGETPGKVGELLKAMGYGKSPVTVLERMVGPAEKRTDEIAGSISGDFDSLNTIAVACVADEGALAYSHATGLPDDAFDHDGNITKRDVRAVTLAALAPKPGEVLWDIGAGHGTVAIEWLRVEPRAYAVAFEKNAARVQKIKANALKLGTPSLQVVEAAFPLSVDGFEPAPDAVFIGGGIAESDGVIESALVALSTGGRLVANAVTLEAQEKLIRAHREIGGELVRIGVSYASKVGNLEAMKAAYDVLQWRVTKS